MKKSLVRNERRCLFPKIISGGTGAFGLLSLSGGNSSNNGTTTRRTEEQKYTLL